MVTGLASPCDQPLPHKGQSVYGDRLECAQFSLRVSLRRNPGVGMNTKRKLVSNYVRTFIERDGGRIRFRAIRDERGRLTWEVLGIFPDGTEEPVTSSNTGQYKILRTADAVVGYWVHLYPNEPYLQLPVIPETTG